MKLSDLTKSKAPFQHLLAQPAAEATDSLQSLQKKDIAVRIVRGSKATKVTDLFDELSAALQFPNHFGANWDACADCLRDLEWINHPGVVILFTQADELLKSAKAGDIETFKNVISDAISYWEESKKKSAKTLHIVFQSDEGNADKVAKKWGVEN